MDSVYMKVLSIFSYFNMSKGRRRRRNSSLSLDSTNNDLIRDLKCSWRLKATLPYPGLFDCNFDIHLTFEFYTQQYMPATTSYKSVITLYYQQF